MKLDPNEPAFPQSETTNGNPFHCEFASGAGLTKRELFAAMAMQQLCSLDHEVSYEKVAEMAVKQADALIAELNKEQA